MIQARESGGYHQIAPPELSARGGGTKTDLLGILGGKESPLPWNVVIGAATITYFSTVQGGSISNHTLRGETADWSGSPPPPPTRVSSLHKVKDPHCAGTTARPA